LIDLAPTLLEIAGGKLEGDGHSLMPLLRGETWPPHAYLAEIFASTGIPYRRASYAVREDSWKLIVRQPGWDNSPFRWKPRDERELYDVDRDPRESRDLSEPEKSRIDSLQARALELHRVHVADPLKLNPDELAALRQLGYTH
jgi:arylsulfatase A-like enzyme